MVKSKYPEIHLGDSFLEQEATRRFGTSKLGDLNSKQMKELDAYITSTEGRNKAQAFKISDKQKFNNSMTAWQNHSKLETASTVDQIKKSIQARKPLTTGTTTTTATTDPTAATVTTTENAGTVSPAAATVSTQTTTDNQTTPNFSLDTFATDNKMKNFKLVDGKKYLRYDPAGWGDFWIDESKNVYTSPGFGRIGEQVSDKTKFNNDFIEDSYKELMTLLGKYKNGGTMNRIDYFKNGGNTQQVASNSQQQSANDIQQQVVALVQAAMQGDEKANQTVNQIMEAAKAGDQQAAQLAQMIQQVVQQMQGQATAAKWGAKLSYIRSLKYAKGGKACPACEKGAPIKVEEKACGGKAKKTRKRYFGGWL